MVSRFEQMLIKDVIEARKKVRAQLEKLKIEDKVSVLYLLSYKFLVMTLACYAELTEELCRIGEEANKVLKQIEKNLQNK